MNSFRIPRRLRASWRAASLRFDEPNNDAQRRVVALISGHSSINKKGELYPEAG
jgi:hypothetical protein